MAKIIEVKSIYVEKMYRGHGYGEKMMIHFIKKYNCKIIEEDLNRSDDCEKMWKKLKTNDEVNVKSISKIEPYYKTKCYKYILSLKK
jgi:hypothetical protein